MPVTITYTGATPTVDADFDTWGDELNDDALAPIKVDLDALAAQGNSSETLANAALPKAGGTTTGDIILADVGPTSTRSVGFRGLPVVSIDADRTFLITDAGKMIRCTGTTARTWTIPPNGTVALPIGTAIVLRNTSTAAVSIVRGAGVALRFVGSATDAGRSLATQAQATLVQEDVNVWVISGVGVI